MAGRLILGWQCAILEAGVKPEMFQCPPELLASDAVERYIEDVIVAMQANRCWIVGYEDLRYLFLMWPRSHYIANIHLFGDGGVWKAARAIKRFLSECFDHLPPSIQRVETKIHDPVIFALVARSAMTYEGMQRNAFWGGGLSPQDEYLFGYTKEEHEQ